MSDISTYREKLRQKQQKGLKTYRLGIGQTGFKVYEVKANNKEEAIGKYQMGEAECIKTDIGETGIDDIQEIDS